MIAYCTIVQPSTLAGARVMASSLLAVVPDARVLAAVDSHVSLGDDEPFTAIRDAGSPSPPELLSQVLGDAELAVYVAPTVWVRGPLDPLLDAARASGVAVVPRTNGLPDDGLRPDDTDLIEAGAVSDGLVAARAGAGEATLAWWTRRVRAAEDRELASEADGRRLELALAQITEVTLVDDPGCQVGLWNLHGRRLDGDGDRLVIDGAPVRTLDLAGFRADRPYELAADASRISVVDDLTLAAACGEYAERLREAGWRPPKTVLAEGEHLGNGQRVDKFVAWAWSDAHEDGRDFGDPREVGPADAFCAWLREPADEGAAHGVNRYLAMVRIKRQDLIEAFPDLSGDDAARLVGWGWAQAGDEVLAELVPAPGGGTARGGGDRLAVNVMGYLAETLGLAEAARSYVSALETAGVPVSTTALSADLPIESSQAEIERHGTQDWDERRTSVAPVFNLACLNGDHLAALIAQRGAGVLGGRPTIGQWGWETDVLPPSWTAAYPYVDEVWVYSRFMAENLGRLLPMPVVIVAPAVVAPDTSGARVDFLDDERFTFAFMVDLFSTLERKNPAGLIDAFRRAFEPGEGPRLLIKTINGRFHPGAAEELARRAGGRDDIVLVDRYLEPAEKAAFLAGIDCYVSLHRSEGFGLPLAEAMALGTPVIATGYSGNLDFMTPFNSGLVDFTPTRVGPGSAVYPAHGHWAEPDVDHAAMLMRETWQNRELAAARAVRARADVARMLSPQATGLVARARLEQLVDARRRGGVAAPAAGLTTELDELERALAIDLRDTPANAAGAIPALVRRSVLRLMGPLAHHERQVDRLVLRALRAIAREDPARD